PWMIPRSPLGRPGPPGRGARTGCAEPEGRSPGSLHHTRQGSPAVQPGESTPATSASDAHTAAGAAARHVPDTAAAGGRAVPGQARTRGNASRADNQQGRSFPRSGFGLTRLADPTAALDRPCGCARSGPDMRIVSISKRVGSLARTPGGAVGRGDIDPRLDAGGGRVGVPSELEAGDLEAARRSPAGSCADEGEQPPLCSAAPSGLAASPVDARMEGMV